MFVRNTLIAHKYLKRPLFMRLAVSVEEAAKAGKF